MFNSGRFSRRFAAALAVTTGIFGTCFVAGCGGNASPPARTETSDGGAAKSGSLPTASIGSRPAESGSAADAVPPQTEAKVQGSEGPIPKEGSPEWLLGQMLVLRAAPLPAAKDADERTSQLRDRNQKLVNMAHEVIRKTHKDKTKDDAFNGAVRFLAEARFQLATSGRAEDVKALQDDAKDLYTRDPKSAAAAEAAWQVARLANMNARQFSKDPRYIQEFAIQSRLFATRFPNDSHAILLLAKAGQTCELYHMDAEAVNCYAMLQDKYPKSPNADQAAAVLRRLELKGKVLKFGGETADGGFVNINQFRGKPVLIVFWASDSEPFQEMLPKLKTAIRPYERSGLAVIGVCLDESEPDMNEFAEKNGLSWIELFYADQSKRRWDHPVVQYYGVHDLPSLWLVNRDGVVVDTHVTPDSLGSQLRYLVASGTNRTPQ